MTDKPFRVMTDAELREELQAWEHRVDGAAGWASAYFAAQQLAAIVAIGNERGLNFVNRFPIRRHG